MEIKVTYIANDGEEFETEEECLEYENRCDPGDSLVMINQNCVAVQASNPIDAFEHSEIYYIRDAAKAAVFFWFVNDQTGYAVPEEIEDDGIYIYNPSIDGYVDLRAELERLGDIQKKVVEEVEKHATRVVRGEGNDQCRTSN